jgi:hypothetical protein
MEPAPSAPHLKLLALLLGLGITSTAVHYTHNFVMASMYPPIPPVFPSALAFKVGIAIAWPLVTALGLWGYRQYRAGHVRSAAWALIGYSGLGISTLGHFLEPTPDIPPFFIATIFTDFLTGAAILIFGFWTLRETPRKRRLSLAPRS